MESKEPNRIWVNINGKQVAYKRDTSMKMPPPEKPVFIDMVKGVDGVWRMPASEPEVYDD